MSIREGVIVSIYKRRLLIALFIIIPVALVFNYDLLLSQGEASYALEQMIVSRIFDIKSIEEKTLILAVNSIYFIVIFHICFGTYIYKDFISNGAYIFTRLKSRKSWFYQKSVDIIKLGMLYSLLFVLTLFALCGIFVGKPLEIDIVYTVFFLWFSSSILIILTTLLINVLSIFYGSHIGFIFGYAILVFLIGVSINFEYIPIIGKYTYASLINPASIMFLYLIENKALVLLGLFYYSLVVGLLIYLSAKLISKIDISITTVENS